MANGSSEASDEISPLTPWSTRAILRVIFIVLAVAAALWILRALSGVLLLVVAAVFFGYLVAPLVELATRTVTLGGKPRRLPRVAAVAIVYVILLGCLALAILLLAPKLGAQIGEFVSKAPLYQKQARGQAQGVSSMLHRFGLPSLPPAIEELFPESLESAGKFLQAKAVEAIGIVTYVPWLVLVPVLAFFLLKDAEEFQKMALQALPRGQLRWRGRDLFGDLNSALASYIRAQLFACLLVGAVVSIGLLVLGVPYVALLGLFAAVMEFIPMVGPLLFAATTFLVVSIHGGGSPWAVLGFLGAVRMVEDYVVYPRLIRRGIHLHPLAVILAILCGAELGGVVGVFLAIPAVAVLSVVYRHWLDYRGSVGLVADLLQPGAAAAEAPPPTQ